MSVLIKGMEMPKMCIERHLRGYIECPYIRNCHVIDNYVREKGRNLVTSEPEYKYKRLDGCPLVEIPTPHGRLVDIDEALEVIAHEWGYEGIEDDLQYKVQSVIESEE